MSEKIRDIFTDGQIYLLLYAYFASVMIVEGLLENRMISRWMGRIGATILILFVGLRWETGTDWKAYFNIFYASSSNSDYDFVTFGVDLGYIIFNHLIYRLSSDYATFLLIDALISIGLVYIYIERSTKLPNMGVYLFYTSYVITHFMGSNRRMLAIGFVCIGFLFLIKERKSGRDWLRWAVPFGLASIFHRTAIMALPGLVVSRKAWPARIVIPGLLISAALGAGGIPFRALTMLGSLLSNFAHFTVVEKLMFYTSGGEVQSAADFDVMNQALLGVAKRSAVISIFIIYIIRGNPTLYAQRLYNIYVIGCALYFLMIGAPVFQVASTYYTIVEIVLLPIIFSQFPQFKVPYTIYLLLIPFLLLISALTPYIDLYVPYRSIFTTY